MTLVVLVFLGGMLTILSPCILPVLPFIFARAEQPFLRNGLPMLIGMALTFAAVATLAAVGGAWAVQINQYGRGIALALLSVFALTLLSERLAEWIARPFVLVGNRLTANAGGASNAPDSGIGRSVLIGVATGLLWAPCAGPILGLVLTGAAISGPSAHTTVLLFAYAIGAAASLAAALLAGGRVFAALKRSLGAGEWVRRGLGVAVLIGVAAIAFGLDSGLLTRLSLARTDQIEQRLIGHTDAGAMGRPTQTSPLTAVAGQAGTATLNATDQSDSLPVEGQLPGLSGATGWLNTAPLTAAGLHGKVVLIDFWTYSCINCLRSLPYIKGWYEKYKDHGLVILGVHSPEFAFEKDPDNVRRAVHDLGVAYPVALDSNYSIWRAFDNQYWPAHYFVDAQGRIRGHHFGEGDYAQSEQTLRTLLTEAGNVDLPPAGVDARGQTGVQAASDDANMLSPETYVGYARAEHFSSPAGVVPDETHEYTSPAQLAPNQWALTGTWLVDEEKGVLQRPSGTIVFRFQARDLHLVMGPAADGKPVRFRVRLDGADPGTSHGADTDASGNGVVSGQQLYQLIRQPAGVIHRHTFTIEFFDSGVQAYSFTFG